LANGPDWKIISHNQVFFQDNKLPIIALKVKRIQKTLEAIGGLL
jgi:hypothetical protein